MQQAVEMMNVLKQIFMQNKDKFFIADMRHDTSYTLYLKMLQRGYFKEIEHECIIDCAAPVQVHDIKVKYMKRFDSLKEFLVSSESNNYSQYFKYKERKKQISDNDSEYKQIFQYRKNICRRKRMQGNCGPACFKYIF